MRQLLLSHLVSKLNSLDIYNIFIDMKTQISKCFVSAHTVMDRGVFKRRVFVFQLFFFLGEGMVIIIIIIIIKCVRIFFMLLFR